MSGKIRAREYYLERLKEMQEPKLRLAEANLRLLAEKERKLDDQMEEIQNAKSEWINEKKEAEKNLENSDSAIKGMLERDFYAEISQRKRGGDPEMIERIGRSQYGIWTQTKNRRKVMVPQLRREGDREFYQNWEIEIEDVRDNAEAYQEWEKYISSGMALEIPHAWTFEKLFTEIERFFDNAPSLEKYGPTRTVYVATGEEYKKAGD